MRHFLAFLFCTCLSSITYSQGNGFPYGQVTYRELDLKEYPADTSAVAVFLDEFGEAYIDNYNDNNILFEYHAKIKILKQAGVSYGTYEIPLRKSDGRAEKIISVKASSFSVENGSMRETKVDPKSIFTENYNKSYDIKKFAIPNVKVGSVIEVFYILESPFVYNFRSWEFQCEIPKIQSEFWCLIPGNYIYNISLKGFLNLTTNESGQIKDCFTPGGGARADCSRLKYGIKNIPAFKEEDYMTAKSNFLSAVSFELAQINYFDGRKDMITTEWKDADQELRQSTSFGVQIRRGKDIVDNKVEQLIAGETDVRAKAEKIYNFIKEWYHWNDVYGKYSDLGIKKAFESKTGNIGDINLSLIAALKYANVPVEPMVLSTRRNGRPTELYPVLSEFNYVIAKVNIGDKVYLLDASDYFHPFGLLPERCLNGKGRVLGDKESYWYDLKPTGKSKIVSILNLALKDNVITGSIQYAYSGYKAVTQRKKLSSFSGQKEYIDDLRNNLQHISIKNFTIENAEEFSKPFVIKLDVEVELANQFNGGDFLFNPFIVEQWEKNPFRSSERLYPVDFGVPLEEVLILNLDYPADYSVEEIPAKIGLTLPQNGGRYLFEITDGMNKVSMNNSLLIARPIFAPQEYHHLKELFNNVIAAQQTELVFKKKK
jgi:hypothetical protein